MRGRPLAVLTAALWWGSLTTVGFMVVPLLFRWLPTPAQAGNLAAQLFSAQTWLSVTCGMLLLMLQRRNELARELGWQHGQLFILLGLLLALLIELAVAPHIRARDRLALWHTVGSVMYAVQWLCAGWLLWRAAGRR